MSNRRKFLLIVAASELLLAAACTGLSFLLAPMVPWEHGRALSGGTAFAAANAGLWLSRRRQRLFWRYLAAFLVLSFYGALLTLLLWPLHELLLALNAEHADALTRLLAAGLLVLLGWRAWFESYCPQVVRYRLAVPKPMARPCAIALVSDTHFGSLVGRRHIRILRTCLQAEQPDLLVLAGDIMDDRTQVFQHQGLSRDLRGLEAPLGKYAVLGNHDNVAAEQAAIAALVAESGFKLLRDERIELSADLVLIGRRDLVEPRLPPQAILKETPKTQIVLDHQPDDAEQLAGCGADLIMCGHNTHKGQIFPATWLIRFFQKHVYGHYELGDAHLIISSGLGLWGLPIRLGARSEIVLIDVHPQSA